MKCSVKTMLPAAALLLLGAALAYFSFESARVAILASLPVLLVLLCPISMLLMMKFMHSASKEDHAMASAKPDSGTRERTESLKVSG